MKVLSTLLFAGIIFTIILLLIGCNGEIESPKSVVVSELRVVKPVLEMTPLIDVSTKKIFTPVFEEEEKPIAKGPELNDLLTQDSEFRYDESLDIKPEIKLDDGFILKGHYGEDGCLGKIYRKDYRVSYLYVFVDCRNNQTKQIVRK